MEVSFRADRFGLSLRGTVRPHIHRERLPTTTFLNMHASSLSRICCLELQPFLISNSVSGLLLSCSQLCSQQAIGLDLDHICCVQISYQSSCTALDIFVATSCQAPALGCCSMLLSFSPLICSQLIAKIWLKLTGVSSGCCLFWLIFSAESGF